MKVKLKDIAHIQFGYYATPDVKGDVNYLQAKHFDNHNQLSSPVDTFINIDSKNKNHLLQEGDIVLPAKGFRIFSWLYDKNVGLSIASSIFFVIRPNKDKVLPEYLIIIFNTPQTQEYFQFLGAGTSIPSIRISELAVFPIYLPPLEIQKKIINIHRLHETDIKLSNRIIEEKKKAFKGIINQLIYQEYVK